jgi:ABC-type branched-subunit amino acid transport system substrate-binding protein
MSSRAGAGTACIVSAALVIWGLVAAPAGAAAGSAREIGVSANEIRIAVVADVDNPISPGLRTSNVAAVRAFADDVNRHGGLGGRKVVVDFYDSKLDPNETKNAFIEACAHDFALVGTGAVFVNDPSELTACPDATGKATGIPDLSTFALSTAYQCTPVSFQIDPSTLDCATRDETPSRYRVQVGPVRYLQKRFGALHGIHVLSGDLKDVRDAALPLVRATTALGVTPDGQGTYFVSSIAPQTAYTPFVHQIEQSGSTFVYLGIPVANVASFRAEAQLQGAASVKAWVCSFECYDKALAADGGSAVDGQLITSPTLPFEEAGSVPELARYLQAVGRDHADGFGVQAWSAGVLFRDVVRSVVKRAGRDGLTRAAFLDALASVHRFTAGGIQGSTDIGRKRPSDCFMVMQLTGGRFVRVYPTRRATFDCGASNTKVLDLDLTNE